MYVCNNLSPTKPKLATSLPQFEKDKIPEEHKMPEQIKKTEPKRSLAVEVTLATHEAGHTVVAWQCSGVTSVPSVTIEDKNGGITLIKYALDFANPWCLIAIDLAGLAAEFFASQKPVRSIASQNDLVEALHKVSDAKRTTCPWKFVDGSSLPFEKMFPDISANEAAILKQCYVVAKKLIEKHSIEYYKLVSLLLQKKTISETNVTQVLGPRGRIALYGQLAREAKFL